MQPSPNRVWPTVAIRICSKMLPRTDSIMIELDLTPFWRPTWSTRPHKAAASTSFGDLGGSKLHKRRTGHDHNGVQKQSTIVPCFLLHFFETRAHKMTPKVSKMEAGSPKGATKQHQAPIFGDLGGSKWSKNNLNWRQGPCRGAKEGPTRDPQRLTALLVLLAGIRRCELRRFLWVGFAPSASCWTYA